MNTRQIQRQKTKQKITDAFFSLYEEKPIEKISIKEITSLAGCHRSTFYEYFTDIYDLLKQEEDSILQLQLQNIITPAKERRINLLQTSSFITPFLNLYEQKGRYLVILLGEHGDPAFARKIKSNIVSAAKEVFDFAGDDIKSEYLLEFIASGAFASINLMYKNKNIDLNTLIKYLHPIISKVMLPE